MENLINVLYPRKRKFNEKTTLAEDDKITTTDAKNEKRLSFFSSAVKNVQIQEFSSINILSDRISNPVFPTISKYNCPSDKAINANGNRRHFQFNNVNEEEVYKEIGILNPRKAAQSTDIPFKILKC